MASFVTGALFLFLIVPAVLLAFRWRTRVGRPSSGGRRHWIRRGQQVVLTASLVPLVFISLVGRFAAPDSPRWSEWFAVNGILLAPLVVVGGYYYLATRGH